MLSALSLANIIGLGIGAFAPLLILAYMHQLRGRRRTVSSVMLLKKLAVKIRVKRKFRPPLRFFLELLALLLLAIAASYPLLNERASRCAVVIDSSLSMRARVGSSYEANTRFGKSIQEALKWVSDQSEQSTFSLYQSAPKLLLAGEANNTKAKTIKALEELQPALTGDSLEGSVSELVSSGDFDSIAIFTDREADYLKDADTVGAKKSSSFSSLFGKTKDGEISNTETVVDIRRVGAPIGNVYIAKVRSERPRRTDGNSNKSNPSIVATLAASDSKPREVIVSIVDDADSSSSPLQSAKVKIDSKRPVDVRFQPTGDDNPERIFRIFIKTEDGDNALTEDDTVWIRQGGSGAEKILFVSGTGATQESLGLSEIQGYDFEVVSPEEFSARSAESLMGYDILIFHHSAPRSAPERPTLLILPPAENGVFPVATELRNPRISSWKEEHLLTSYLQVPLLRFNAAITFATPLWAQPVISVEQGAVVVAGESRGIRFLGVGFELMPFSGGATPTVSILTLNILGWLSNTPGTGLGGSVGSSIRLEPGFKWEITTPQGKVESVVAKDREPKLYQMEQPGKYLVAKLSNGTKLPGGAKEHRVYTANIIYPEESSTFATSTLAVAKRTAHEEMLRQKETPLWPLLVIIAIIVIVCEWIIGMVRRPVAE